MNWKNKKQLFILLLVFGLIVPFLPALAQFEHIGSFVAKAVFADLIFWFIVISTLFLEFSLIILKWVVGPNFMPLAGGITQNQFVLIGWTLTRDLANMFFIIILVVIGLATALRKQEYKLQKLIPTLIGVTLLINFTPVIMGFIIDASNIIMNFFLREFVGFQSMQQRITSMATFFSGAIKGSTDLLPFVFQSLTIVSFNVIAGFIFLLFALLFIFRYIALWTLVILSPIAFFCYILPSTKKYFDQWWSQFIQWSIIGIVAAFFIYLSEVMIVEFRGITAPSTGLTSLMTNILPYALPLGFLILGFFIAMSTSAMGSSYIISGAKKGGTWARKKGYRGAIKARRGLHKTIRHPRETAGMLRKKWDGGRGVAPAIRSSVKKMKFPYMPSKVEEEMKFEKEKAKYAGEAKIMANKYRDETIEEIKGGGNTPKMAALRDMSKKINPELVSKITKRTKETKDLSDKDFHEKITKEAVQSMSPKEFTNNISSESLKNKDVRDAMSGKQKLHLNRYGSKEKRNAFNSPLKKEKKEFPEEGVKTRIAKIWLKRKKKTFEEEQKDKLDKEIKDMEKKMGNETKKSGSKGKLEKEIEELKAKRGPFKDDSLEKKIKDRSEILKRMRKK